MTNDFSDIIIMKHGHSGDIFRGLKVSGTAFIKMVDLDQLDKYFINKIMYFDKVLYAILVSLLPYYSDL